MGQYLMCGITHKIGVAKEEFTDKDRVVEVLSEEYDMSCYDCVETDGSYEFIIKPDIFNSYSLIGFLGEQLEHQGKTVDSSLVDDLVKATNYKELVSIAQPKQYCEFQENLTHYRYDYSAFKKISVYQENIIYFIEGKAYLECYSNLFDYIRGLIRTSSKYAVSGAVTILLE